MMPRVPGGAGLTRLALACGVCCIAALAGYACGSRDRLPVGFHELRSHGGDVLESLQYAVLNSYFSHGDAADSWRLPGADDPSRWLADMRATDASHGAAEDTFQYWIDLHAERRGMTVDIEAGTITGFRGGIVPEYIRDGTGHVTDMRLRLLGPNGVIDGDAFDDLWVEVVSGDSYTALDWPEPSFRIERHSPIVLLGSSVIAGNVLCAAVSALRRVLRRPPDDLPQRALGRWVVASLCACVVIGQALFGWGVARWVDTNWMHSGPDVAWARSGPAVAAGVSLMFVLVVVLIASASTAGRTADPG